LSIDNQWSVTRDRAQCRTYGDCTLVVHAE